MKRILLLLLFFFLCLNSFSQKYIFRRAEKTYNILAYSDAIPLYEYVLKKDSTKIIAMRHLADCYRLVNNSKMAEFWYFKLIKRDTLWVNKLYLAEAYLKNEKFSNARSILYDPTLVARGDERVIEYQKSLENMEALFFVDTANIKINKLKFNNYESDYCPVIYRNNIIFTTTRTTSTFVKRNHSWTDERFVSLYESSADDQYSTVKPFGLKIKSKLNTGPVTFSRDYQKMFYTINNPKKKSTYGFKNLRILSSKFIKGKWRKNSEFPYNSNDYANAHPSLSLDGESLYFSSNKPGGFGGMDIYVCKLDTNLNWGTPINLGPKINSIGDELFPYVFGNDKLYFSSTGHGGLGGLDIYVYTLNDSIASIENLGAPFNSSEDDFGFCMQKNQERGFFSSDRGNEGVNDDIYSFMRTKPKFKPFIIFVIDSNTNALIPNSSISLATPSLLVPIARESENGRFPLELPGEMNYDLTAKGLRYKTKMVDYTTAGEESSFTVKLVKKGCSVQGIITAKGTNVKLDSVQITLTNLSTKEKVFTWLTDTGAFYLFDKLQANTSYSFKLIKSGYFAKDFLFETKGDTCFTDKITDYDYLLNMQLEQIIIGKAIKIDNIYFDLGKWAIRPDAAIELNKIVKLMNENPSIVIELGSHTDARGSDESNRILSDKRAKSSAAYIISQGILENRIKGKGYGESLLVNKCADGIKCSEPEHQQNRRTEFKVTGFLE